MKTSTMMTCMMTGKMCMCKSMDMCFAMCCPVSKM